jgi:hypothetical protein
MLQSTCRCLYPGGNMNHIQHDDLVLIAIINNPRDLEIARILGWYRIPVKSAPKTLWVEWLAFYQTAAFGEQKWSIKYVARVKGFELVRRYELLQQEHNHPRARDPYFKVELGPLKSLTRTIPSRSWKRFTFLYTTGQRLLKATDMTDLTVPPSEARDRLWRLLEERRGWKGD